ncbi:hypothetical protein TNIN_431011 [Trichonephila inaurata madagascariensis]|uniref:Uncharacterized protein n=1 Tax=Trichonephila inaurata madagascariensis TaxID=2747483 RepID=A0A8X6XUF9_9ARAC|nr:hypothetical protein TNIN_431011 [Trichonephila inaurata madagascariensis]
MDYRIFLPFIWKDHPRTTDRPTFCARLEVTKADIRRYTLIVQGYDNMITSLKHSNAQDEHDPPFSGKWSSKEPITRIDGTKR